MKRSAFPECWESGGVRYTAANCNKLLRIQANSLVDQPSISACQSMPGDYYCDDSSDLTVAEPQGARYIRDVVVRYRTFGRTYRFASQFYTVSRQLGCPRLLMRGAALLRMQMKDAWQMVHAPWSRRSRALWAPAAHHWRTSAEGEREGGGLSLKLFLSFKV